MIKFLKYKDAKILVRNLGIKCAREWREYIKVNKTKGVPTTPDRYYKKTNEWENLKEWLKGD